ncbi:hypothetical protein K505DRAFT_298767 [Melanomma pulvis-pyrius CBS 109.77]|uniref:polynucleotide adenylyltransferase n=1 Tax=Melanomma pulvis-pyrius CBS 109.77 TaxID=1314802 RepID=A0A6A6XMS4_9PLEO|nr:hypothetical protein K505DRAFT_298767 [Melanomma pulvis-pyrius CBS 109.77]
MATSEGTVFPNSISITSYDTALCIIPPPNQCHDIDSLRSLYDKSYGKWPPHINILYPFVSPDSLPRVKEQIQSKLLETMSGANIQSNVQLDQAGYFSHRVNNTIFLRETNGESSSPFRILRSAVLNALGQRTDAYSPHLTIGQSEDQADSSRDFLLSKAGLLPNLGFEIQSLAILVRERIPGQDKSANRMRLWATIDLPGIPSSRTASLSEFWLKMDTQEVVDSDSEDDDEERASDDAIVSPFSRKVRPGTTYQFDPSQHKWISQKGIVNEKCAPDTLAVSSYNVLVDSEFPPARDRDPLLVRTILSQSAVADILVLEEVSDDFLSYFLANPDVRQIYPFTTHGPPNQSDIAPLPSLRNVIIVSRWSFSWEFVPFHRRHKGAVVTVFDSIAKISASNSFPLVVAGVHLTCGLTDGSVAAKKVQLQNLKNHLTRNYSANPWVVAGDFNITTSTYTIETALKNKTISQQTSGTLLSLETMMTEAGLLDAWSVARVEATDHTTIGDSDDLFEGEDGSTFNPRENELAAATSGTSNNRPQRYDRILVRPQELLRINHFNHFGVPQIINGTQVVPSDHSGIRSSMKVFSDSSTRLVDGLNILLQYPVVAKHGSLDLSNISALTSALSARHMFPTEGEIQGRREAFALLKQVILGSTDDGDTSMADIPLVMVPVGSYAIGAWTSTSDIDCLCIGSISSKTFFKLARHRIFKALDQGIRLVRKVDANTGTMFEISVGGVELDLQYCPAARIVERWSELPNLHHSDPIFSLPILSLRKLKPYRDLTYIQRTLPSLPTFRLAYRCIKLWAVQRGIYSSKFGYLGGIHITLMLSWICKRLAHDIGSVTTADVVTTFFHHYANFDWGNDMVFDAIFYLKKPRYQRSAREPMVVLGFHAPNANVAHTSTVPGTQTLVREFKLADHRLSEDGMTWEQFFGGSEVSSSTESPVGVSDFLKSHDNYVKVDIQYWGRTLSKGKGLVGWVESRCLNLVVDLNKSLPNLQIRIWPARFTATKPSDSETDYHGCYLIGLSKTLDSESATLSKEDKALAKQALHISFEKFVNLLHADERNYDPTSTWIGISLAKPSEVSGLRLDEREWGDYVPDLDEDSEDEDLAEDLDEATDTLPAPRKLPVRPAPSATSTPVSTSKLRPASDVLHRLRWDPNLDPSDFIVGYEDRFLGAKETSLERWKTEQTDDEFIPQHRILYFKRRGDGDLVWERRTRIDKVFGSGVGAGERSRSE